MTKNVTVKDSLYGPRFDENTVDVNSRPIKRSVFKDTPTTFSLQAEPVGDALGVFTIPLLEIDANQVVRGMLERDGQQGVAEVYGLI